MACQRRQRDCARRYLTLHVERAASPHLAVSQLSPEGIRRPLRCVGKDDIRVREEEQGRPVAGAPHARDEVRAFRDARIELALHPAVLEVVAEKLGCGRLVSRRIGRIDANELLQELCDLGAQGDGRHQRRVPSTSRYSPGASTWPSVVYRCMYDM